MDRIQYLANLSVRRACGFAGLAIFTTMFGMAGDPALSIRIGAAMFALWIMLDSGRDLPPDYPPQVICQVLREVYLRHAELSGVIALAMGLVVLVLLIVA